MSKIAKQFAAGIFLSLWRLSGYKVKKIDRFSQDDQLKSIAIFSTTALGDFLFNTPAIAAIKARWPQAKLILVIGRQNEALVAGSPLFDDVLLWNGKVNGVVKLARQLRRHRIDATFSLHSRSPYDIMAASMAFSSYILKDVYYNDYHGKRHFPLAKFLSTHYENNWQKPVHIIEQKSLLLQSVGIDMPSNEMFIPAPFEAEQPAGRIIGIHAGASSAERCWPAAKFSQVINILLRQHPDLNIVLIGSAREKVLNQTIIAGVDGDQDRIGNLAGTTNLTQLAAKIASLTCLIVGDTGPLHMAVALKTPTISLFGEQAKVAGAAPRQDHHLHQVLLPDDEKAGLQAISVAAVCAAVEHCLRTQQTH